MALNTVASVLMPVGHIHSYLLPAVQSVLQQTFSDLELIIIDNAGGQVAGALQSVNDPRARIVPCDGQGISAALNAGTGAAFGQFWFRCDSDDLYPKDRIARQINFLNSHPEFGAVTGGMSAMTPAGKHVANMNARSSTEEITDELRQGICRSSLCSWGIRMEIMRGDRGFRPYFITAEDIDMQLRLGERCRVWFEAQTAYHYRLHDSSITHSQPSDRLKFFDAIARAFQQQRRVSGNDALDLGEAPPVPTFAAQPASPSHVQDLMIGSAWELHRNGEKIRALRSGLRAFMYQPTNVTAWRTLAALILKPARRPGKP